MKNFLKILLVVLVTAVFTFCWTWEQCEKKRAHGSWHDMLTDAELQVDTVTFVDTVKYYEPVPKRKKANGFAEVKVGADYLQAVLDSLSRVRADTGAVLCESADSVTLQLPNTQSMFADSTYTAWISGVNTRLDSIYVFPKREVIEIRHPPKRWHIGLQGGYGYGKNGFEPFVGIGVTYSLISF